MYAQSEKYKPGFAHELKKLRSEIDAEISIADLHHLKKMEWWGRVCTILGYTTAWFIPNPVSAFLISQGSMVRWAIMMHHVGHKGYDKIPGNNHYKSKRFAMGWRRYIDWLDWMHPAAWNYEHNVLHHYHTSEPADPDLLERNVELVRNARMPVFFKYLAVIFFMCTWKFSYYAPNTFWMYQQARKKRKGERNSSAGGNKNYPGLELLLPFSKDAIEFWCKCLLPYATIRFLLLPLLFLPFGFSSFLFVLINSLLAELITNIYTFIIIVPNHAGDDLYRYEEGVNTAEEFYIRQVMGTVNYPCGNNRIDFLHGWLNYQIEHHLFPDIPLLKYQQYQPKVKALCKKYDIPYLQENVFKRFMKMLDIAVGKTSMPTVAIQFPIAAEQGSVTADLTFRIN
ncbi:MAG TPA: fatty acid desaturase [Chitinophagales bacterium]|nr:fatty acid desaturase [Chitinophagales bacterium]